ncbi:hypothetical protein IE077_000080 [Cardiosporidium cionae]|uniref:Uncharacterized protein n=1 Tax=Cardiosporidium cionae TaxID=476202 RepID=A0ABQ7JG83_9APIC|nr:hypothetical protein IE077_000080 [Cardiosporidium cionae]|eukprot:KAF8823026.1 hypothetical protein IE077_000080 [Cardiosporidium cionae]
MEGNVVQVEKLPELLQYVKICGTLPSVISDNETCEGLTHMVGGVENCISLLQCPICLNVMECPAAALPCGHLFCCNCIQKALAISKRCPLCKQSVDGRRGFRKEEDLANLIGCLKQLRRNPVYSGALMLTKIESSFNSQPSDTKENIPVASHSLATSASKRKAHQTSCEYPALTSIVSEKKGRTAMPLTNGVQLSAEISENVCVVCCSEIVSRMNYIVKCNGPGCKTAVHRKCYGILNHPVEWYCYRCEFLGKHGSTADARSEALVPSSNNTSNSPSNSQQLASSFTTKAFDESWSRLLKHMTCCICGLDEPLALKPTTNGMVVHLFCALWIPEVSIVNAVTMDPVTGIELIPSKRWNLICSLCRHRKIGYSIHCSFNRCKTAVHPMCALKSGAYLEYQAIPDSERVNYLYFCDKHKPGKEGKDN